MVSQLPSRVPGSTFPAGPLYFSRGPPYFSPGPTLGMYPAAADQASYLDQVQHRGPPVQDGAPGREGPAYDAGQGPAPAGVIAQEQQRKGVEQAQCGCFPDQADLQGAEADPALQHGQRPAHDHLAELED